MFTTVFLQYKEDGFGQIPNVIPENNQQIYTRANYRDAISLGLSENLNFNPFRWWSTNNQILITYVDTKIKDEFKDTIPAQDGWFSSFSTQNSFILNSSKTFLGEINLNYQFPSNANIYQAKETYSLDFALKCLLFNKDLIVTLAVNDIFRTSNTNVTTFTNNIKQVYNIYGDNRSFKLSLYYAFGNKKIQVKKRDFGNQEEKRRTN